MTSKQGYTHTHTHTALKSLMQGRSHVKDRDQHVMITHLPHTNIHIITKNTHT
jgi:hypothetical protein